MSLYGNFTLREWLSLHCATKQVNDLFRKSLNDNDEPMAILAMSELIKRGDTDLVTFAIRDATDTGCFRLGSHFCVVFANALSQVGSRDPVLRLISKNVRIKGYWPQTAAELFEEASYYERPVAQDESQVIDGRLDAFLEYFKRIGWFSVEFGYYNYSIEFDPLQKENVFVDNGELYSLSIRNGFILNGEEIPNVLRILDDAEITEPLPAFNGKAMVSYTLDNNGNWTEFDKAEEKKFYVSYRLLE